MRRPALPLLLLLSLGPLLAGCASPAAAPVPAAAGASPAVGPDAATAADATAVPVEGGAVPLVGGSFRIGTRSYEPTIGADAGDALFTTADVLASRFRGPTVLRSLDNGRTWEDVGPKLPGGEPLPPASFDPFVHVDRATGRVFMDDIFPVGCGVLSWSDDQGATWTTNPLACGNPQLNDHQTLVTARPRALPTLGYPNVVHRCVNNILYAGCAASHDGGRTFRPQTPVDVVGVECSGQTGHLAADPDGRVFLPFGTCSGGPMVAVSEDDGLTWTGHRIDETHPLHESGHDVALASDEAGNVYALWPHEGQLWLAHSVDHGKTWSPARNVTAREVTAVGHFALAAGAPGRVALAYVGTTLEGGYEGRPTADVDLLSDETFEEWAGATWNGYVVVILDALAGEPDVRTAMVNPPGDPLARGLCGRTRCQGMGDFMGMTIGADGRPWAAFVDVCTDACVRDPDAGPGQPQGIVGTLLSGPSLRAEGGPLPVLASAAAPEA